METLKGVVGLGNKKEEGQEPVSGAKGEGTTSEPYDSGNKPEATEAADQTQDSREFDQEHSYLSSAIDADHARAADESKSEPPAATEEKKGGGTSFLKSFGLGGRSKKTEDEQETQAGAAVVDKEMVEKHLAPNHLGSAVPEGASRDLADPGTVAPGQTDGIAATKDEPTTTPAPISTEPTTDTNPRTPSTTAAGKQPDRVSSIGSGSGVGISSADRSRSTGGTSPLLGSRGEHRGSMIPADAVKYKRVENPDRIPTAGGKRIGEEQYQTRRASVAPSSSPPRDMKALDREGSPDAVTAGNTEANTVPASAATAGGGGGGAMVTEPAAQPAAAAPPHVEGKNTAPQQMKAFSMGSASKEAEAKPLGVGETEDVAPDEGAPSGNAAVGGVSAGEPLEKKTTAEEGGGSGAKHGRRGSVFDKLKDKLKGHKK